MEIRIKSDALPERDYVHFMYNGIPYTFTRYYKKFEDKVVLQALKEEPHNFESKEKIKITPKKEKEETIVESGTVESKESVEDIKVKSTIKKVKTKN